MCGIAGYIGIKNLRSEILNKVCKELYHRGPDENDIWLDKECNLGFAHTRLSIQDLSKNGSQPMFSNNSKFVIIFNGEIYNHHSIRSQLNLNNRINWKGNSDTETFLEALSHWGIEKTLLKSSGMFAFALWDMQNKILTLGRDRFGEKPLYYKLNENELVFASELKAIKVISNNNNEIDADSLRSFISLSYIPAPKTIYKTIYKVKPGTYIQKSLSDNDIKEYKYFSYINLLSSKKNTPMDDYTALQNLEAYFFNSIKKQRISDAPIGCFLSGGIDSSLIASIMQLQSSKSIDTFTVGFEDKRYDESFYARKISNHLKTNHHELIVNEKTTQEVIPSLPEIYDEPFADSSQIPTYLISKFASNDVKVCLSGDGGDELFGGYNRYVWSEKILSYPFFLRKFVSNLFLNFSLSNLEKLYSFFELFFRSKYKIDLPGDKIHKLLQILLCKDHEELYKNLISTHNLKENYINGDYLSNTISWEKINQLNSNFEKMMIFDLFNYLPDDILCKVDRASMSNSLEIRAPMLDDKLVSFAWNLPINMKIRNGESKWILKKILQRYVPKEIIDRPKKGFAVPIGEWIRGPLKDWAINHLNSNKIKESGYINNDLIQIKWKEHLSGKRNWQYLLWNVISFQAWLDKN